MRLLLFSDLHCDTAAAEQLVAQSAHADVAIGAGDFANVRQGLSACIGILRRLLCPAVLVAGNNETTEELRAACAEWPQAHILHGNSVTIEGQIFFGLGGGVPVTPFGAWSYDLSEAEAAALLHRCPANAVLISHSPPKGAVDLSSRGQSLGSTAVRDAVLRLHPKLVVCGHIHGSAGRSARLGETTVINAGPAGILHDV